MTDEAVTRRAIRKANAARLREERHRAATLNAALVEPAPNELVKSYQARAARARQNAAVAIDRNRRRDYLKAAKDADDAAAKARSEQLDRHWATLADGETAALAKCRGDDLEMTDTEVADWSRDKHGAVIRDDKGLPVLRTEKAKARRKVSGLTLLRNKGAISELAYEVGLWFGQVCSDAAEAEMPGREETGIPAARSCKPSQGPADWKLKAVEAKKRAEVSILRVLPRSDGEALIRLLVAVCRDGRSVHFIADGDRDETARLEGRVATGLAILRHHRNTPPRRDEQTAA